MSHGLATALVVSVFLMAGGAAAQEASAPTRVRSEHATIAWSISQATEHSATFRREIEAINRTDGLIYVDDARCGHGVHACLMHSVVRAGPYRLLRVKLDLRRPELQMMAALGHELQHAIEALSDPGVISNSSMVAFFQQLAPTDSANFETPAAFQAGVDVFNELTSNERLRARRPAGATP